MTGSGPIAVFDSGIGGLSVLSALLKELPEERFIYLGDRKNAPYGDKSEETVRKIALENASRLFGMGAKALVVACNTATAAAIGLLRQSFPDRPVIGIEPAVKPAFEAGCRRVVVLATPRTVAEPRFSALLSEKSRTLGGTAMGVPCPGLSLMIEDGSVTEAYFTRLFEECKDFGADGIVLGCTHYPFAAELIRRASGGLPVFDGAAGTARHTKNVIHSVYAAETPAGNTCDGMAESGSRVRLLDDTDGFIDGFIRRHGLF